MKLSELCITRPVATTLLTLAVALTGTIAFFHLSIAPIPQIDFPFVSVQAAMPGASPEVMASSVAAPLERRLGRIADVAEMNSTSSQGATQVFLMMNLSRNIDAAARDVQAAINAARADLPVSLRANPTYLKYNPNENPILILALTSKTLTRGQLFDAATLRLEQRLAQVEGVGRVIVGGSSLPGIRVELNAPSLFKYGIGLESVRAALAAANANGPKGAIESGDRRLQIYANDQATKAEDYRRLVVAYRNGAAVRLSDVAEVVDSVEDLRTAGLVNGEPAVQVIVYRQPGANMVEAIDKIRALLPALEAALPSDVEMRIVQDRTLTIRTSLHDIEMTLLLSVGLVILVVFIFLHDPRATLIATIIVPVSLIGTFGAMYILNYTLDNLSLMALTIATGFVVDDAIVVVENIMRHLEAGASRLRAAILGVREVAFTVICVSVSLIAVFAPILFMGGLMGRMLREFTVTLSIAIGVSLILSLTTTPMLCAQFLRWRNEAPSHVFSKIAEHSFAAMLAFYDHTLGVALRHPRVTMAVLVATIGLNVYLFTIVPKGLFPIQDTGRLRGAIVADQNISFEAMQEKLAQYIDILDDDPAVTAAVGSLGVGIVNAIAGNSASMLVWLRPLQERGVSADEVIARLRRKTAQVPGASLFLQSVQDIYVGATAGNGLYQYTLQSDNLAELRMWAPKLTEALRRRPELADVNSDQQDKGLVTNVVIDRESASRLGLSPSQIDNTLYDAFGQRQVSTIYTPLNRHHVVMEIAPAYRRSPEILDNLYVSTSGGPVGGARSTNAPSGTTHFGKIVSPSAGAGSKVDDVARNQRTNQLGSLARGSASTAAAVSTSVETMIPLSSFAHFAPGAAPLAVNHRGNSAAITISFNVQPDRTLADASAAIREASNDIGLPTTIHGAFRGAAGAVDDALRDQTVLILAALATVYVVLGVLYESFVHPLTILSTLPSAGVGAVLALLAFNMELTIVAMIGVVLLIGVVKKNAIMMIDFALQVERREGLAAKDAIRRACVLRFRPILMTTMVALLGALPLAFAGGEGAEIRRPLGLTIVGGLIVSQIITLYTTPVVYLYLDRFRFFSRAPKLFAPKARAIIQ